MDFHDFCERYCLDERETCELEAEKRSRGLISRAFVFVMYQHHCRGTGL